jgi:hypothetical protein
MNKIIFACMLFYFFGCINAPEKEDDQTNWSENVKKETIRTWKAYQQYAWGFDVLLPLTKDAKNWYDEPLYISPIDAYSTFKVMGLKNEAQRIETYVTDSISFDKDMYVKVFEVNIRVLGGLLAMYQYTENPNVLAQAKDFADRMLPAFESETGIPHYWVNLKTGDVKGDTVNVAEAGTYTFEMGILSYYTKDPVYYQIAKHASKAVFERRSEIGLVGETINIETGEWINTNSHICAGIDSYYEYMYKTWLLFDDPEVKEMWDESILAVNTYLPEIKDSLLWYRRVDMFTGEKTSSVITLYDAFFPAILAISGDVKRAEQLQHTWKWLWDKYGLEPMVYDYDAHTPNYPVYDLNPEIIESAFYLYQITGKEKYREMALKFYKNILRNCKTEVAFTAIENVETMEKRDYMATYFIAETLKYFYLIFQDNPVVNIDDYVFSTEAHNFKKENFIQEELIKRLGLNE